MSWLRNVIRPARCHCGSGLEAGFCTHKGATAQGETANGKRTSGGSRMSRRVTGAPPAGKRRR